MDDYIKVYSELTPQELRQLKFKRKFKADFENWDDSMILLRDLVSKNLSDHSSVLDIGCGNGNFVIDELDNKISEKIGVDYSKEYTRKNTSMNEIIYGDISSINLNKQFDLVTALWVLEHLESPEAVFQKIYKLLKPEGIFAFVTPYKFSYLILFRMLLNQNIANKFIKRLYGREDLDIFPVRYRANTIDEIKNFAGKTGFKTVELKLNFDPSYTSFNSITYLLNKLLFRTRLPFFNSHLIGILKK